MVRAMGGERSPVSERTSARKNRIFASKGIEGQNSMRAEAHMGNGEVAKFDAIHPHFCRVFRDRDYFCWTGGGGVGGAGVFAGADEAGCGRGAGGWFEAGSGRAGVVGGSAGAAETSATIFSVAALLTAQAESQMRHCARVNLQPQVQVSALKR